MSIEGLTFRLHARGRPAGRLLLNTGLQRDQAVMEARLQLQGVLGTSTIVQLSRSEAASHRSLRWRESHEGKNDPPPFEVRFDRESGAIAASRGRGDKASLPYLLDYRDPLSMIRELRERTAAVVRGEAEAPELPWTLPLLGHPVHVVAIRDGVLENRGEERRVRSYTLQPGGSVVVIELAPPFAPVRLLQRLAEGSLEATLVEIGTASSMAGWEESTASSNAAANPGGRRRGRRRRSRGRG